MECLSPISIQDKKSPVIGKKINVPCGKCIPCLSRLRNYWSFRLQIAANASDYPQFVTLTYDDDHLPKMLVKNDLIRYFKRLRKISPKLKYFAVGEYGTKNFRPHYHALIMNSNKTNIISKWTDGDTPIGMAQSLHVSDALIHYLTKYMINPEYLESNMVFQDSGMTKPFRIMSKGLGIEYITDQSVKYHQSNEEICSKTIKGHIAPLPRYLREKIFSKDQLRILNKIAREKLVEKNVDKTYDQWQSEKRAMYYLAKQKSKSNERKIQVGCNREPDQVPSERFDQKLC